MVTRVVYRRSRTHAKKQWWERVTHTLMNRPLKAIAVGLGIAAAATPAVVVSPTTGNSVIGHAVAAWQASQEGGAGPAAVAFNIQSIPTAYIDGVKSGQWIVPAIGAAVTAFASKKFKI